MIPLLAISDRQDLYNMAYVRDLTFLTPEAQKQVIDFIAFLKTRNRSVSSVSKRKRIKLAEEPFIGMWRNRADLQDSTAWVRHLRQREWERAK